MIKSSNFVFDYVHLLYHKQREINLNSGGSYLDSTYWIKKKKATINPSTKKENKSFQNIVTVTLNHEWIKNDPKKVTKIKPF